MDRQGKRRDQRYCVVVSDPDPRCFRAFMACDEAIDLAQREKGTCMLTQSWLEILFSDRKKVAA